MKKRTLSLLLVLAMLLAVLPMPAWAASAGKVWDGRTAEAYAGGTGTEEDPYLISNGAQLYQLALDGSSSTSSDGYYTATKGKYYKLTQDIDMGSKAFPGIAYFSGILDGANYTIENLKVTNNASYSSAGLVKLGYGCAIRNLSVEGSIGGAYYAGGIIGTMEKSLVENCTNRCAVSGSYAGGICGNAEDSANIQFCHNYGTVVSDYDYDGHAGGICGLAYGYPSDPDYVRIQNCSNFGTVISANISGGICGSGGNLYIHYSANAGHITGSGYVGGILGYADRYARITNSYNCGIITSSDTAGGICGYIVKDELYTDLGNYVQRSYNCGILNAPICFDPINWNCSSYGAYVYYLLDINESATRYANAVGLTSEDMTAVGSFTGFDFANVWTWDDSGVYNYPILRSLGVVLVPCEEDAHTWNEGTVMSQPTCTEDGALLVTCMQCSMAQNQPIPALGHDAAASAVTPPTCTEDGLIAESKCTRCDYVIPEEILPAQGHDYGEPVFTWNDDNTATATVICQRDGSHVETLQGVAVTNETTPGDCQNREVTVYTATVTFDGETYTSTKSMEGAYGNHTWNDATCTAPRNCALCGAKVGSALGHDYGEPVIVWNADNTASAVVTCTRDPRHFEELAVTVTSTSTEGNCKTKVVTTYTATVTFEGETYTVNKTVEGNFGDHSGDGDNDHLCDTCGEPLSVCVDTDNDHFCNICDTKLSECSDTAPANHKCDICGETLSECIDENKDYVCDICGAELEKPDEVIRLAGTNRFDTAIKVADEMKAVLGAEKFDGIILANGYNFADALAGSYLSAVKNAPILLTWNGAEKYNYLNDATIQYVKDNLKPGGTVYILGGTAAVPASIDAALAQFNVERMDGANRFETNIMILEEAGVQPGSEVLVCTSTNFADSLSASAAAKPILLVWNEGGRLFDVQKDYLGNLQNCTFTVIGGESAVGVNMAATLMSYGAVSRLAGANRFETSVMVAQKYFKDVDTAVLAYAWNYPDGLCGGSLAYSLKAPLILTMTKYEAKAVEYMTDTGIEVGLVLGGDTLISDDSVRSIFAMEKADGIIVK